MEGVYTNTSRGEESETGENEEAGNSAYQITKSIYLMAKFLNRDVDDILRMAYSSYLYWKGFATEYNKEVERNRKKMRRKM